MEDHRSTEGIREQPGQSWSSPYFCTAHPSQKTAWIRTKANDIDAEEALRPTTVDFQEQLRIDAGS